MLDDKKETISSFDLLIVLAKRWKLIFGVAVGSSIFIVGFSFLSIILPSEKSFLPDVYKSQAIILFNESSSGGANLSSLLGDEGGGLLSLMGGMGDQNSSKDLIEPFLYKKSLLNTIIEEMDVITKYKLEERKTPLQEAQKILKEKITVEESNDNPTITINVEDIDPQFAETTLLRIIYYLEIEYKKLSQTRIEDLLSALDENIIVTEQEMNNKLAELINFQKRTGIVDPGTQLRIKSSITTEIENKIFEQQLKMGSVLSYKERTDPQVLQMKKEIALLEKGLRIQAEGSGNNSKYNHSIATLLNDSPEFYKLQQELSGLQQLYIGLRLQQQAKALKLVGSTSTFQVIEKPSFFTTLTEDGEIIEFPKKSGPSRGKLCIIFVFALTFLAVLLAFILEFFGQIKKDPKESEKLKLIKSYLPSFKRRKNSQ